MITKAALKLMEMAKDDTQRMLKVAKNKIPNSGVVKGKIPTTVKYTGKAGVSEFERTAQRIAGNRVYAKRLYNYQVDKMNHPISHVVKAAATIKVGTGVGLGLVGAAALAGAAAIKYKQKQTESDIEKYRTQTSKNADDLMKAMRRQRIKK
jgi:hypothetical protein